MRFILDSSFADIISREITNNTTRMSFTCSNEAFSFRRIYHSKRTWLCWFTRHIESVKTRWKETLSPWLNPNPTTSFIIDSYEKLYCFFYQAPSYLEKIWDPFLLATEYMRMGIPNQHWKIDDGNSNFDLCDTYPPLIYVPTSTSKAMLLGSSKFRSRGRLPALSYCHPNGVRRMRKKNRRDLFFFWWF